MNDDVDMIESKEDTTAVKEATTTEVKSEVKTDEVKQPEVVAKVEIQALSNGNVIINVPEGFNLWVLRGMLSRALAAANAIELEIK